MAKQQQCPASACSNSESLINLLETNSADEKTSNLARTFTNRTNHKERRFAGTFNGAAQTYAAKFELVKQLRSSVASVSTQKANAVGGSSSANGWFSLGRPDTANPGRLWHHSHIGIRDIRSRECCS